MHPVAAPLANMSGTPAPIGGYRLNPLGPYRSPRRAALGDIAQRRPHIVTATWIGADGEDIRIAGTSVQSPIPMRTAAYSVPFGAFGGIAARGSSSARRISPPAIPGSRNSSKQAGIGRTARCKSRKDRLKPCSALLLGAGACGTDASGRTRRYELTAGAFDTTNNQITDYDALVVFDALTGIAAGPFASPSTGPAYVRRGRLGTVLLRRLRRSCRHSPLCRRRGTGSLERAPGVAFRIHSRNQRSCPSLTTSTSMSAAVRIPTSDHARRVAAFDDLGFEAIHRDQTVTFLEFATRMSQRAMARNPDANLAMIYLDQPDASAHQFLPTDTAGDGSDRCGNRGRDWSACWRQRPGQPERSRVIASTSAFAYRAASDAVERIIQAVGVDQTGRPLNDVIVVSDHGISIFTQPSLATLPRRPESIRVSQRAHEWRGRQRLCWVERART